MTPPSLTVLLNAPPPEPDPSEKVVSFEDLNAWVRGGGLLKHLFRYASVRLLTSRIDGVARPFLMMALLRLLSRGPCWLEEEGGARRSITLFGLLGHFFRLLGELPGRRRILGSAEAALPQRSGPPELDLSRPPVYLRTDLWFGVRSGGSVGHIAGVLNNLSDPIFLTSDPIPTVDPGIETHVMPPDGAFQDFLEIPAIRYNGTFLHQAEQRLAGRRPGFVYQRYSAFNDAGARLARRHRVPLVLEFNGSEVWINRHWGRPFLYEALAEKVERANLEAADLIVVVSDAIRVQLMEQGLPEEKILVNPNGADPERYSPEVDGAPVRARLGLDGKRVIGFIGTFGLWHGAEILVEAFGQLRAPDVHLLLVGDGLRRPAVEEMIQRLGIGDVVTLTGLAPQEEGPAYLAACNILASPHAPNPDGSEFFGSPTKLFEYMGIGKGIVASRLGQIGEVLEHERTAVLVAPGDPAALAAGLQRLLDDPALAARLGEAARRKMTERFTWKAHTGRIVERLGALFP